MRRLAVLIALVAIIPGVARAQTPEPTRAPLHESCHDLDEYRAAVQNVYRGLDTDEVEVLDALGTMNITEMRPSEVREVSSALDHLATQMERMPEDEVPYAARSYHDALVDTLGIYASMLNTVASGNPWGAMVYEEAYSTATNDVIEADRFGQALCFDLWRDAIGEGVFD